MLLSACIQLKIACNKHVACSIFPVGIEDSLTWSGSDSLRSPDVATEEREVRKKNSGIENENLHFATSTECFTQQLTSLKLLPEHQISMLKISKKKTTTTP